MIRLGSLRTQDCQHIRRRELLQMGACSALGLSLPQWLAGAAAGHPLEFGHYVVRNSSGNANWF